MPSQGMFMQESVVLVSYTVNCETYHQRRRCIDIFCKFARFNLPWFDAIGRVTG